MSHYSKYFPVDSILIVAIFIILDFVAPDVENLTSIGQTLLVASLPVSTIWASHESGGNANRGRVTMSTDSTPSSGFRRFRLFKGSKDATPTQSDLEKQSRSSYSESDQTTKLSSLDVHPPPIKDENEDVINI
jgi:hypothetical protein